MSMWDSTWKARSIDWQPAGHRYTLRIDVDPGEEGQSATAQNATDVDSFNSGPSFTCTRVRGPMAEVTMSAICAALLGGSGIFTSRTWTPWRACRISQQARPLGCS